MWMVLEVWDLMVFCYKSSVVYFRVVGGFDVFVVGLKNVMCIYDFCFVKVKE